MKSARFGEAGQRVVERLVAEELLRVPAGGDVEEVSLEHRLVAAVGVGDDTRVVLHPDDPAVAGDQPILDAQRLPGRPRALVRHEDALPVVGMEQLHEQLGPGRPVAGRVAEHRLDLRARVHIRARFVEPIDVDGERERLDERPVPVLGPSQRLLRLLALGDLDREALAHVQAAVERLDRHRLVLDPHDAPVGGDHPVLVPERLATVVRCLPLAEDALAVVLVQRALEETRRHEPLLGRVPEDRSICGLR